jgi:ribonuclease III
LDQALTHKSAAHEKASSGSAYADNERLEFFGDSVLALVVSDRLFAKHPEAAEGELSRIRGAAVSQESLAAVAQELGIGSVINLGRGEIHGGGQRRPSILSSAFEAVIAAVYLSSGLKNAESFIQKHMEKTLEGVRQGTKGQDYKSQLQELTQRRWRDIPRYEIFGERGPEHKRLFECRVHSGGRMLGQGKGRSKKEAEQRAAEDALRGIIKA